MSLDIARPIAAAPQFTRASPTALAKRRERKRRRRRDLNRLLEAESNLSVTPSHDHIRAEADFILPRCGDRPDDLSLLLRHVDDLEPRQR